MRYLKAKYMAYGNLSCLEVITHLKSNYYKIILAALKEKAARITFMYDLNQPFETSIDQIEMAVNFADARGVSYTPKQVDTTAYNLLFSTGYCTNSCQLWNVNLSSNKNWVTFKPFLANEHQTW